MDRSPAAAGSTVSRMTSTSARAAAARCAGRLARGSPPEPARERSLRITHGPCWPSSRRQLRIGRRPPPPLKPRTYGMDSRNFFAELRRRNVYRAAAAYGVVAWLLIQIATQVFPFFDIPNWAVRFVIVVLLLGFPLAMIVAWIFEWTPEGLKRTSEVPATDLKLSRSASVRLASARRGASFQASAT